MEAVLGSVREVASLDVLLGELDEALQTRVGQRLVEVVRVAVEPDRHHRPHRPARTADQHTQRSAINTNAANVDCAIFTRMPERNTGFSDT